MTQMGSYDRYDANGLAQLLADEGRAVHYPTQEQATVIEAPCRPLLVVAGAGAGKTTTMSQRVLWLIAHEGYAPESILGLTFSRKAAAELGAKMRNDLARFRARTGCAIEGDPQAATYNSFAHRIVSEYGMRIGLDPDVTLLGQARSHEIMTQIVATWPGDLPESGAVTTFVSQALSLSSQLGDHRLSVTQARRELTELSDDIANIGDASPSSILGRMLAANNTRLLLLDIVQAYQAHKRAIGAIDYADQLVLAHQIITTCPDVVDSIRQEYQAVLLDEFQDTSVIQMDLLATLFHDTTVTAVGDPNQAIYGWRGASAASLESFLSRFNTASAPEACQTLTLSTAWRNDHSILVVANAVAQPLREHSEHAKSPILRPRAGAGVGSVDIAYGADIDAQVRAVVHFVKTHRIRQGKAWKKVAVLSRRRNEIHQIDLALRQAGIPTHVVGIGGLLEQSAVADVRAALAISANIGDSPSLLRLIDAQDIGASDISVLWDWAKHLAQRHDGGHVDAYLVEAVDTPPPPGWSSRDDGPVFSSAAHQRISILGARLRAIRAAHGLSVVDQVERCIHLLGIVEDIIADPLDNNGRVALDAFVDVALTYTQEVPGASLRGFLTWMDTAIAEERGLPLPVTPPEPGAVELLTIHASKGLEWDAVAVVGMCDGIFPSHRSDSVPWTEAPPSQKGWLISASELPTPLRGDQEQLPPLVADLPPGEELANYFASAFAQAQAGGERVRKIGAFASNYLGDVTCRAIGAHNELEERRLAYVALTRARSAMLLTGAWHTNGATKLREPSRYLMEALTALRDEYRRMSAQKGSKELQAALHGLEQAITPKPEAHDLNTVLPTALYPKTPGPTRQRVAACAHLVEDRLHALPPGVDPLAALHTMESHPLVDEAKALFEERRSARSDEVVDLSLERLSATALSRLIETPAEFAEGYRRPMPTPPSAQATLGTLLHTWIERELRTASETLWEEPLVGIAALNQDDRAKLKTIQKNFAELELLTTHVPVAVEQSFTVDIAGISIQGRIDAVMQRRSDGRACVIDWKTGRPVGAHSSIEQLNAFATQLRLYRTAWARHTGTDESDIDAVLVFLSAPSIVTLEQLEAMLRTREAWYSLEEAAAAALGESRAGRSVEGNR
ncbi:ATP-dependent helicase [Schaalia suimastitidis]|uniref:ATP-dependent helicase n=1 Tax=Schaalia suimastitidis TaxID=121163 RepID=UPI0004027476|nr:ATP-dependent DNA helicase [Schaalia suimastitidis]